MPLARQEVGSGERKRRVADDNAFYILLLCTAQRGQKSIHPQPLLSLKDLETSIVTCEPDCIYCDIEI